MNVGPRDRTTLSRYFGEHVRYSKREIGAYLLRFLTIQLNLETQRQVRDRR